MDPNLESSGANWEPPTSWTSSPVWDDLSLDALEVRLLSTWLWPA